MKSALNQITEISHLLPLVVLKDIDKRCGDWLATGGTEDDPYIHQQLRFAKKFIEEEAK